MDDCGEIITPGFADVSYMSIFKDFNETVTYGKDMYHGRIIEDSSMVTIDFTMADNHDSTLGTSTSDLENDTGANRNLYTGQAEEVFGLFGNSIGIGNVTANISGSSCDQNSCFEDELHPNYDTKESDDDEPILIESLVWLRMNLSDYVM